jgi:hypothetical protein
VMVGMYFTYKNTNGEVIKINQPIQSIDTSNNRIVLKYNQADIPSGNTSPAPTAATGARNTQGAGLATYGGNSMGMGLYNGGNNNIQIIPTSFGMQPPRRGSGLYETTKRWNNGSDLTGPIRFRSFNKRSTWNVKPLYQSESTDQEVDEANHIYKKDKSVEDKFQRSEYPPYNIELTFFNVPYKLP